MTLIILMIVVNTLVLHGCRELGFPKQLAAVFISTFLMLFINALPTPTIF